jgi:hypothetical protein
VRGHPARLRLSTPTHEGIGDLADARPYNRAVLVVAAAVVLAVCQPAAARYPSAWLRAASCIHYAETGGGTWATRWDERRNSYSRGGMQFLYSTWWRAVERHRLNGYPADPANATRAQQLFVAWLLYLDDGRSWHEWSTAGGCGLA